MTVPIKWLFLRFLLFSPTLFAAELVLDPVVVVAGQGDQVISFGQSVKTPTVLDLAFRGKLAIRLGRESVPVSVTFSTSGDMNVTVTIPGALCKPGIFETTLWNTETNLALPFRTFLPFAIPTAGSVAVANPDLGKLVVGGLGDPQYPQGDRIDTFSLATGSLLDSIPIPAPQTVYTVTPDLQYAWLMLSNSPPATFVRMNLATRQIDQRITFPVGFYVPRHEELFVFRDDPRFLYVKMGADISNVNGFFEGQSIPLSDRPLMPPVIDQGRLLTTGPSGLRMCKPTPTGFENCTQVQGAAAIQVTGFNNGRVFGNGSVMDASTGKVILNGVQGKPYFFPLANRILMVGEIRSSFLDGETLEFLAVKTMTIRGYSTPNWILWNTSVKLPGPPYLSQGTVFGQSPYLAPRAKINAVLNAATGANTGLAPGEIVSIYGANLGPAIGGGPIIADALKLATEVEGTEVLFNGIPGAVLYSSTGQVNVVVPEGIAGEDSVLVEVVYNDIPSPRVTLPVENTSPGLFAYPLNGRQYAAALNATGTVQSPTAPLQRGSIVNLWATGLGLPPGEEADGIGARAKELTTRPRVRIGGKTAKILYAGLAPFLTTGLTQIAIEIPSDAPTGDAVEIVLDAGGRTQGGAWAAIR